MAVTPTAKSRSSTTARDVLLGARMQKTNTNPPRKPSNRTAKILEEVKTTELEQVTGGTIPRGCPTCGLVATGI
jgi:hypothetical protein